MTKSQMSAGFAKFASKTTKGGYEEARKGERMGRGVPFPVGTKGTGVVSKVECDETKPDNNGVTYPRIRVEIRAETPEVARGKQLSGSGLMQTIKDGPDPSKWSAEQAFGAALGMLEDLGLPTEISQGYSDFQEVLDWFDAEPRKVSWEIQANDYVNKTGKEVKGKQIYAVVYMEEADIPSADAPFEEHDPNSKYCMYRGAKHRIVEEGETLTLRSVSGTNRSGIAKDDVEMIL